MKNRIIVSSKQKNLDITFNWEVVNDMYTIQTGRRIFFSSPWNQGSTWSFKQLFQWIPEPYIYILISLPNLHASRIQIRHVLYYAFAKKPQQWKSSVIIRFPLRATLTENNDFRPAALTSVVMKAFTMVQCWKWTDDVTAVMHLVFKQHEDSGASVALYRFCAHIALYWSFRGCHKWTFNPLLSPIC